MYKNELSENSELQRELKKVNNILLASKQDDSIIINEEQSEEIKLSFTCL